MSDDPKPLFSIPALPPTEEKPKGTPLFSIGAAGDMPDKPRGLLDNAPGDTGVTGTLKNLGSGLIDAVTGVVGQVGDLDNFAKYGAQRLKSWTSGKPLEQVQAEREETEKQAREAAPAPARWLDRNVPKPPSSVDVRKFAGDMTDKATDALGVGRVNVGNYEPMTEEGKLGRTLTSVVPSVLAPGKLAGRAPTMATAREAVKTSVKAAPMVALGTTAAHGATEWSGDPLVGALAGIVVPMAAAKVTPQVARLNPFKDTRTEAGTRLRELATNADDVERIAGTAAPGQTLGQATGDKGVLVTENRAQSLHDKFRTGLSDLYDQQNARRIATLNDLERGGDPRAVASAFNQHLDDLTAFHDTVVAGAERTAQSASGTVSRAASEDTGGNLRGNLDRFSREMRAVKKQAYDLVDPDGTLVVPSSDLVAHAQNILDRHPRASSPIDPRTKQAFDKALELDPRNAPYAELRALDANINEASRIANLAGNASDERLLGQLKTGVQHSLNNAVENHAAQNAEAVAQGRIPPEMSFENQLRQSIAGWQERQQAAMGAAGVSATGTTGAGSTAHTRPSGAAGEGPPGQPAGRGDQEVPGDVTRPFDETAREQLNAAHTLNRQFQHDYRQGPVADILKSASGMVGDYKLTNADVTSKAFVPGKNGYETANRIMEAGAHGPEVVADMRAIATSELRAAMDKNGGMLSQSMLDNWRNKYGEALRAIDEVSPGFSGQFNNVAAAHTAIDQAQAARTTALRDFERGAAQKFLGLTHADDVVNAVGSTLSDRASAQRTQELLAGLQGNPAALEGARRAGVDWMLRQFSTAAVQGGERTLSPAQLMDFITKKGDTLRALYGDVGADSMQRLLAEMTRRQQDFTTVKTAGSDTAAKAMAHMTAATQRSAEQAARQGAGSFNTMSLLFSGRPFAAALSAVGNITYRKFIGALHERNIVRPNDLMMEALLNPGLAAELMAEARRGGSFRPQWGRQVINAIDQMEEGGREMNDRNNLTIDMKRRAAGGRIGAIDHEAEAARYVRLAARAKTLHGKKTESFLKVPDATVAKALAVAHEAI